MLSFQLQESRSTDTGRFFYPLFILLFLSSINKVLNLFPDQVPCFSVILNGSSRWVIQAPVLHKPVWDKGTYNIAAHGYKIVHLVRYSVHKLWIMVGHINPCFLHDLLGQGLNLGILLSSCRVDLKIVSSKMFQPAFCHL